MDTHPWYRRSELYVAVVLPYLAVALDMIHMELASTKLSPTDPIFVLLVKLAAAGSFIYSAGQSLRKTFGPAPVGSIDPSSLDAAPLHP